MTIQALPYITLLGFFFGSTLVVSRFSVGQFHPTTYIGLRMLLASVGYVILYTAAPHRFKWPRGRQLWRHATLLGVIGTAIPMTAVVTSLLYQSSGVTAILLTCGPAVTVLMAHFGLPDERLNWRKTGGIALALAGAMVLALRGESGLPNVSQASPVGYILVFVGIACGSAMTIYARKFMRGYDSVEVSSIRMFVAALVIMPVSVIFVGLDLQNVDSQGYVALVYAALVGTFAGFLLAFHNVKRFGATTAAMVLYITPIVAALAGIVVLGETISTGMLVGTILIVIGIALINQREQGAVAAESK